MNGLARVGLFLVALALVLGGAAAVGRAVGPLEREVEEPHADESEAPSGPVGLALAANGFRFSPARTELTTGSPAFGFRIVGARRFDVVHERRMHLIVVRRDLQFFQHVHPKRRADGSWTTILRLPSPGVYRAFADFAAGGKRTVLGIDLFVSGRALPAEKELQIPRPTMTRDGNFLTFDVGSLPEPYLGARGHLVVLRVGDLAYIHTHPDSDELRFETELPTPGRYRAFLQYRIGDEITTAEFPLEER